MEQWLPFDSNLGVYELNTEINLTITLRVDNIYRVVSITPLANAIYNNSLINATTIASIQIPSNILLQSNTIYANVKGYFDGTVFTDKFVQYVTTNTYTVQTISGQQYDNIWTELNSNLEEVFQVTNFRADPKETITFELLATSNTYSKTYYISVNHPSYSIDRDIFISYFN